MAESAASAPPPRPGPPLIPPPRSSRMPVGAFEAALGGADAAGPDGFDSEDEALPALVSPPAAPGAGDDGGPPLEELEAQMRGELAARDENAAAASGMRRRAAAAADDDDDGPPGSGGKVALPELDALVARIPAEVRETLDELFRARFVAVKKLPKYVLQPASSKVPASGAATGPGPRP